MPLEGPQLEKPTTAKQPTCPEPQPQLNIHDELLEKMRYLRLQMEHTCQQNISIHRGQLHLHEYLYNNVRGPYPGMTPPEFLAYLQWPGDSPTFPGGGGPTGRGSTFAAGFTPG